MVRRQIPLNKLDAGTARSLRLIQIVFEMRIDTERMTRIKSGSAAKLVPSNSSVNKSVQVITLTVVK